MPSQRLTFQSISNFSFSSNINGQQRCYSEQIYSDPSGTKVRRTSQEPGQAPKEERFEYDSAGRKIEEVETKGRIEDVTDKEKTTEGEKDREYEKKVGDDAKRERGA
ncbi:uncharacterized protein BDR25DRAFT_305780 [Lindgomyces ingoldianus]|uniref:Uncharacterized protein n=1 Tax=Lindgomyces ingoldianus TaxID=673940 RepID=A0ACB6QK90_9PLEO|nr:uncharacterized protein BDR25DRAFT_305780 [Lindgomyces ingoldianus]KAF2466930.1 hypothetical protein BDR25DRAFT_305780 [Lindgomyces ingoldianus]